MKKINYRYAERAGRPHTGYGMEQQQSQVLDSVLNRSLADYLAGRAKGPGSLRWVRSAPGGAYVFRVPQNARAKHAVVQFQVEQNVQLHQDSYPGSQEAYAAAPAENRRVFEAQVHNLYLQDIAIPRNEAVKNRVHKKAQQQR